MPRRLLSPAWPSWCSADARLAASSAMLMGAARSADPLQTPETFLGSKIRMSFDCAFEASPHATEGSGHVFFWPAPSAKLGLRFSLLATSTYLEFWRGLEASLICVVSRRKLGAQTGPMMLMMLALGGLCAGCLKCAIQPNKTLKIHAVGTVCGYVPVLVQEHHQHNSDPSLSHFQLN